MTENVADLQERRNGTEEPEEQQGRSLEDIINTLEVDPDYTPQYDLREWTGKDTRKIMRLANKIRNTDDVKNAAVQGGMEAAAFELFGVFMEELEEEVFPWLADLAQKKPEELADEPGAPEFDIALDLVKSNEGFLKALRSALRLGREIARLFGR
jgi:hypothetical protein